MQVIVIIRPGAASQPGTPSSLLQADGWQGEKNKSLQEQT